MNFFSKSKKAKEQDGSQAQAEVASKPSRSLKRKQKAAAVEVKPQFDLSTALPASNDFRTSLMLPGLSARFSMLREQDDPSSKLGKASDDSVLFPKRQSRLNIFGHNPLADIAEVESIYSFKAPFADGDRSSSVLGDYSNYGNDDASSMISRSRPVEGNSLFGGRQKVFKVAPKTETGPATVAGRYMYNNDVPTSLWQQQRLKARLAQDSDEEVKRDSSQSQEPDPEDTDVSSSPATGFSNNRGTTSSTNSGPSNSRTSTAATSEVSESPLTRQSTTVSKKSFTIGDDASSPVAKSPGTGRPPMPSKSAKRLSHSKSATNLHEKYGRSNSVFASSTAFRAASPLPTVTSPGLAPLDFGFGKDVARVASGTDKYRAGTPDNLEKETDEMMSYVQPSDRGKATAMGLFNKPQRQYSEEQFSERQRQMHGGRSSPCVTSSRSESPASPEAVKALESQENSTAPSSDDSRKQSDVIPTAQTGTKDNAPSSPQGENVRTPSNSSKLSSTGRPRKLSSAANSAAGAAAVQARVEDLIRRQNAELVAEEREQIPAAAASTGVRKVSAVSEGTKAASSGTFFSSFDASDEESMDDSELTDSRTSEEQDDPSNVHPALRSDFGDFDFGTDVSGLKISELSIEQSSLDDPITPTIIHHKAPDVHEEAADSPTLGPNAGLGLSGLVRTHLRNDSDRSTLPPSPPLKPQAFPRLRDPSIASTVRTVNPPESLRSDPWELERPQQPQPSPKITPPTPSPTTVMSQRAHQLLEQARMHRDNAQTTTDDDETPGEEQTEEGNKSWQEQLHPSHQRGASTETAKEREEFDREMAERRRRIQAKLKNSAQTQIRSQSPGLGHELSSLPSQALSAIKHKTSKTSMRPNELSQPKAMKMLGIQPQPSPREHKMEAFHHDSQQAQPPYGRPPPPRAPHAGPNHPSGQNIPRGRKENSDMNMARSVTPSGGRGPQSRAFPPTADRSRSRPGQHRDEHPIENRGRTSGQSQSPPDQRQPSRGPDTRSASAMSGRYRSNSRPAPPHGHHDPRSQAQTFYDPRSPPQPQTFYDPRSPPLTGPSNDTTSFGQPRPSPRPVQYPSSPALSSALPSPMFADGNGRSTPTFSGRSTPLSAQTRKRSIVKGMISEPTFVSSTSSVPLVNRDDSAISQDLASPPIPAMNPRRRGTFSDSPTSPPLSMPYSPTLGNQARFPLPATPESPVDPHFGIGAVRPASPAPGKLAPTTNMRVGVGTGKPPPKPRNKLRKISSEGGGLAAKARFQAQAVERGKEDARSPMVAVFPNRSATSLGTRDDGMF